MAAIAVIPARFGSTRFPGKIVACETGKPLVQHVVERAKLSKKLRDVIVATDDQRIIDALRPYQTRCVMTSAAHVSGTDRIAEVARRLEDTIIVNIQGDEPEIDPKTIDELVARMEENSADRLGAEGMTTPGLAFDMATAATPFPAGSDPADVNLVKVVLALDGRAIYFSRSVIPFQRDSISGQEPTYYLHQGIYAYRREFLLQFASWPPTPLEQSEKLEQLRVLEHGRSIYVVKTRRAVHGIDTPQQYQAFVNRIKGAAGSVN